MTASILPPWIAENVISGIVRGGAGLAGSFVAAQGGVGAPMRGPVLIDELRFTSSSATAPADPLNLRVTISTGRQSICEDVPLDLLCRPLDFNLYKSSPISRAWRFPRPLFLPHDANLAISARLLDVFSAESASFNLTVAAVGRSLPDDTPAPKEVHVPFAADWSVTGTASGTAQSTPSDLRNKTRETVDVERFSALAVVNGAVDDAAAAGLATLQLFGQNGLMGVRDETPSGVMAFYGRLSWTARSRLPGSAFYVADLTYTLPTGESGPWSFGMAVVGSRAIPVEQLGVDL